MLVSWRVYLFQSEMVSTYAKKVDFPAMFVYHELPRKSKDQTLPSGSTESFTWIILKTILCLVLDFQGVCISSYYY